MFGIAKYAIKSVGGQIIKWTAEPVVKRGYDYVCSSFGLNEYSEYKNAERFDPILNNFNENIPFQSCYGENKEKSSYYSAIFYDKLSRFDTHLLDTKLEGK